jgi:hypothetical protein
MAEDEPYITPQIIAIAHKLVLEYLETPSLQYFSFSELAKKENWFKNLSPKEKNNLRRWKNRKALQKTTDVQSYISTCKKYKISLDPSCNNKNTAQVP